MGGDYGVTHKLLPLISSRSVPKFPRYILRVPKTLWALIKKRETNNVKTSRGTFLKEDL